MPEERRSPLGSSRPERFRARLGKAVRRSATGKVTFTAVRVFDLQTDEPQKNAAFMDQDEPIYLRLKDLPVAELLGKPRPTRR